MKKLSMITATLMMASAPVWAGSSYDYARVIDSRPIYQQVQVAVPEQHCWNEQVATRHRSGSDSRTPVVVSTIVGGAIGNALGNNKSNQRVGAVVGAALGHSIGRDIVAANRSPARVSYQTLRQCETVESVHFEERVVGYQVRYRYQGQDRSIRMDHDPGDRIRVRVSVQPVF
jgi:uncharacterized protein YcfJ